MTDPQPKSLAEDHAEGADLVRLRERYGLVLVFILAAYVIGGLDTNVWVEIVTAMLWTALLLTTLWAPGVPRRVRAIGMIAVILILVSSVALGFASGDGAEGLRLLLLAVAQLAALLAILSQIVRHSQVTLQTVMGGIAAYALIAFVAAAVYSGADLLTDETFLNGVVARGDYTYFSFVTLTTVGYGDITAAGDLAKRLVVVEAFVGQVFIIVFVARLVSLWGKPERVQ
ncbi:MAG TPA: potassium channel family protein [Acidimicrobiia bacterium]|nr:potassium channel family protein [Acidimicrobiia bacterium]